MVNPKSYSMLSGQGSLGGKEELNKSLIVLLLCGLAETSHSVHTGCHALRTKLVEELSENNYREEG